MGYSGYVAAWICIGIAEATAGWLWPFRRGAIGITVNAVAGVAGALGIGFLGIGLGFSRTPRDPFWFLSTALGALLLLLIVHAVWEAISPQGWPAWKPRRKAAVRSRRASVPARLSHSKPPYTVEMRLKVASYSSVSPRVIEASRRLKLSA
jgi:uncharacterized membrane protein YeaQ/YmgE (transglycosylase-associated protein family)